MSQNDSLGKCAERYKLKNLKLRIDDKEIYQAMTLVIEYLKSKQKIISYFSTNYDLEFATEIEIYD